jgi:hypothetical protein
MKEARLENGTRVVFSVRSGNDRIDPSIHEIESSEEHEGRLFYRLKGMEGALFVRGSLATTKERRIEEGASS